jgi:hypothetical protein
MGINLETPNSGKLSFQLAKVGGNAPVHVEGFRIRAAAVHVEVVVVE